MVLGQVTGPHCLYFLLSLLRLIFKTYKNTSLLSCFSYIFVCSMSGNKTYSVKDVREESMEDFLDN